MGISQSKREMLVMCFTWHNIIFFLIAGYYIPCLGLKAIRILKISYLLEESAAAMVKQTQKILLLFWFNQLLRIYMMLSWNFIIRLFSPHSRLTSELSYRIIQIFWSSLSFIHPSLCGKFLEHICFSSVCTVYVSTNMWVDWINNEKVKMLSIHFRMRLVRQVYTI